MTMTTFPRAQVLATAIMNLFAPMAATTVQLMRLRRSATAMLVLRSILILISMACPTQLPLTLQFLIPLTKRHFQIQWSLKSHYLTLASSVLKSHPRANPHVRSANLQSLADTFASSINPSNR
jgi:hypothetical protein